MTHRAPCLVTFAVLLGILLASGFVAAHAQYVSSTPPAGQTLPTAPTGATVTLSEAIESGTGTIRVTNATGARFDVPPVTYSADGRTMTESLTSGGPGIYTVTWTATSAVDGHFTAGSFSYCVQDANGTFCGTLPPPVSSGSPVSPLEVALRSIGFLGLAIAFGLGIMANFMWIPAGDDPDARASRAYGLGFPVLLNVGRIAAFAFIVSMAGLFGLATGLEGNTAAQALGASPYVQSVAIRLALGVVLFALVSRAFGQSREGDPPKAAWTIQAAILVALAGVVAGSVGTHAAAATAVAGLGIAADAAHFSGIGLWFGGLAGIVAIRRFFREPEAAPLARIVLGRFSRMAAYAVGLVLAGGIGLAVLLVGTLDALITSPYGWVVLAKVGLFAPMLALGAYNRYRLVPKTAESERPTEAVRRIVGNVRFETSLGIAVLVLAGLLTSMTPAATVAAGPVGIFALDLVKDGLKAHFEVYPPPTTVGVYTLTFLLTYASNGTPFNLGGNATIQYTLTDPPRPPVKENLSGPHGNHYFVSTTALSSPGVWKIDANFRRLDSFDLHVTFYVTIKAGG